MEDSVPILLIRRACLALAVSLAFQAVIAEPAPEVLPFPTTLTVRGYFHETIPTDQPPQLTTWTFNIISATEFTTAAGQTGTYTWAVFPGPPDVGRFTFSIFGEDAALSGNYHQGQLDLIFNDEPIDFGEYILPPAAVDGSWQSYVGFALASQIRSSAGYYPAGLYPEVTAAPTFSFGNEAPTISEIEDQVYDLGNLPGSIPIDFTVDDAETPLDQLEFTVTSSDQKILTDDDIDVVGSTGNRQLVLRPKKRFTGISTITVEVSDGSETASTSFDLVVAAGFVQSISSGFAIGASGKFSSRSLAVGDPVFQSDLLMTTNSGGFARIRMFDATILTLGPRSIVNLTKSERPKASVMSTIFGTVRGRVTADVPPFGSDEFKRRLFISTKIATHGVRGTKFTVETNEENGVVETTCTVTEGLVQVEDLATGDIFGLGAGESRTITGPPVFSPDFQWTGPKQGVYDFFTETGCSYSLLRSTDLSFSEGSTTVIDSVVGDGLPASLSFDDSESSSERAFFQLREQQD